jgi:hypothetical protein
LLNIIVKLKNHTSTAETFFIFVNPRRQQMNLRQDQNRPIFNNLRVYLKCSGAEKNSREHADRLTEPAIVSQDITLNVLNLLLIYVRHECYLPPGHNLILSKRDLKGVKI